ncbi:MAG: hypothetical protein ACYDCI_14890 [Candidatus Limnocylindrales bacterium]
MGLTLDLGWIVFLYLVGLFLFAAGHGVSFVAAFRIKRERDPARIRALLPGLHGGSPDSKPRSVERGLT